LGPCRTSAARRLMAGRITRWFPGEAAAGDWLGSGGSGRRGRVREPGQISQTTCDHSAERTRTFFVFCCSLPGEAPWRRHGRRRSVSPRLRRRAGSRRCNVQVGDRVTDKSGAWQGLDNAAGRDTQVGTLDPIGPMIPEMRCSIRVFVSCDCFGALPRAASVAHAEHALRRHRQPVRGRLRCPRHWRIT